MSDQDWNRNIGGGFGEATAADELYHGTGPDGDSLTETWYWGFHIPEAKINCFAYCWVHPNLGVVTSGLFIYKGRKSQHLACELFDMRDYMSMSVIGDGSHIALPNSMEVRAVKPLEQLRMTFVDEARETSLDLDMRAVAPPVMRANNKHFEQVMHATGTLTLRGSHYAIDCYPVRDRSWGELRPEDHAAGSPPYTWVTGTFGETVAFNIGAHDDPTRNPDWQDLFDLDADAAFKDGWLLADGEQRRLASASLITRRDTSTLQPVEVEARMQDPTGRDYTITGKVIAVTPWSGWSNMNAQLGLVEWSWGERVGWGEVMDCHWNDYVHGMSARGG